MTIVSFLSKKKIEKKSIESEKYSVKCIITMYEEEYFSEQVSLPSLSPIRLEYSQKGKNNEAHENQQTAKAQMRRVWESIPARVVSKHPHARCSSEVKAPQMRPLWEGIFEEEYFTEAHPGCTPKEGKTGMRRVWEGVLRQYVVRFAHPQCASKRKKTQM